MAHDIPYSEDTYTIEDELIPGNSKSDAPVEFDIAPAGGPDLARLKSIIFATAGLTSNSLWTNSLQTAVEDAFRSGGRVFEGTVLAVRNFTVPAGLAHRVGIWPEPKPPEDRKAKFPITTGKQFSAVSGFVSSIALAVAFKITTLSGELEGLDPRFFVSPSGSGKAGISAGTFGSVSNAPNTSARRGTAGKKTRKRRKPRATTSSPGQ